MRGQQMCPLTIFINMWTVSSHQHQHTRVPLAAAFSLFMSLLYPPYPWGEWCNVWRLATPPGSTSPTLFKQWGGSFYIPQEPDKCKCCVMGHTFFCPYPKRLRESNRLQMSLQRQRFLFSYLGPWVLVWLGFEPATSHSAADWCSPNWANQVEGELAFLEEQYS